MPEKEELAQQHTERESAWRVFLSWFSAWQERSRLNIYRREELAEDEPYTSYATYFIDALTPNRLCDISVEADLASVGQLLSSIRQVSDEGTITDDEATALTEFVAAYFIERHVDRILLNPLGGGLTRMQTFQRIAGSLKHGRAFKPAR